MDLYQKKQIMAAMHYLAKKKPKEFKLVIDTQGVRLYQHIEIHTMGGSYWDWHYYQGIDFNRKTE